MTTIARVLIVEHHDFKLFHGKEVASISLFLVALMKPFGLIFEFLVISHGFREARDICKYPDIRACFGWNWT
jgi:hypothetical protein